MSTNTIYQKINPYQSSRILIGFVVMYGILDNITTKAELYGLLNNITTKAELVANQRECITL